MHLRPLTVDDADLCAAAQLAALAALRAQIGLPSIPNGQDLVAACSARIRHLVATDPNGSWLTETDNTVTGFAQAARRDDLWVLAHLFVAPSAQSQGLGSALLNAVTRYESSAPRAIIGSTADPRAIRSYARLDGFEVHPCVTASGRLRNPTLDRDRAGRHGEPAVRNGTRDDLAEIAALDLALRRGAHGADMRHLLDTGHELLVVDDRGYAVSCPVTVVLVAGVDTQAATALLRAAIGRATSIHAEVQLPRMTAGQQWAIRLSVEAGLALRPWGPLITRGFPAPPTPYLPHSALC